MVFSRFSFAYTPSVLTCVYIIGQRKQRRTRGLIINTEKIAYTWFNIYANPQKHINTYTVPGSYRVFVLQVRKFDYPEVDLVRCLLPLHTSELGKLSIPEEEREPDPLEDGGVGDTRTEEEALEEYKQFMEEHNVPEKV